MQYILLILVVIVIAYLLWPAPTIIRFSRKTCPACQNTQAIWEAFVKKAVREKINVKNIVEVDIENNSIHTREMLSKYHITGVPTIIKQGVFMESRFNGEHTIENYMKFAE